MNKLKIYINKDIVSRFKQEKIDIDYIGTIIIILLCLYEKNYELLDEIDDANKSRRLLTLYRYLYRKGLIIPPDEEDEERDIVHYILTEKGAAMANYVLSFNDDEVEVRKEYLSEVLETEAKEAEAPIADWIEEWIELFPEGRFSGRLLRTNGRDCLDRMTWFIKTFKYTKDHIFEATRQYIRDQAASPEGHRYTRNSTYFICKGRGVNERISDLATACAKLKQDGTMKKDYIDRDSI